MRFQSLEYQRSDTEYDGRGNPEKHRRIEIFEKPLSFKKRRPVPVHDIEHRIQFKKDSVFFRNGTDLP